MNAYKKYLLIAFIAPMPFMAILFIILYFYDPLQFFHKPYFRNTTFFGDMYFSARGIIQHYNFDSYILGTSMLENTSAKEAKEKLGGEWVNISLSGSSYNQRAVILDFLFKIKPPKAIIYSLDYLINPYTPPTSRFDSIYGDSPLETFKFYLKSRFILCAITWSSSKDCVGRENSLSLIETSIVQWKEMREHQVRFNGFKNWIDNKDNPQLATTILALQNSDFKPPKNLQEIPNIQEWQNHFKQYVLSFVAKHPTTKFYFIIPTYSRLFYFLNENTLGDNNAYFATFKTTLKWLTKELEKTPNATLYGLDTLDYANHIENYRDTTHYHWDMNSMQLDAIANKTHRLDSKNIDSYLAKMYEQILNFDMDSLIKQVQIPANPI
ncbi:hypothetical protein [Helicobacter mesocricetorum]|uniref:hypothetical protein n=1 Tax=Helicobacter mesocricetorum TaxID=87012 RepID=UPI000CF0EA0B|nr:hypothetical protein [Helicobacter mesocricetorum]